MVFKVPGTKFGWGSVLFINGNGDTIAKTLELNPDLNSFIAEHLIPPKSQGRVQPTSDNWPYLYIEKPMIPMLFFALGASILILWAVTSRFFAGRLVLPPLWQRESLNFFALGLGFVLLQVFIIAKASILFGSTWIVNSIVISGMMLTILVANWMIAKGWRFPLRLIALLLVALCASMAFLSFQPALTFGMPTRILMGTALSGLPTLFSGILFGSAFNHATIPSQALGSNLFGSLVGALLQSVIFWLGINSLAILGAAAYLLAWGTTFITVFPSGQEKQL